VNQISRILCAVDFSDPAQAAFKRLSQARMAENAWRRLQDATPTQLRGSGRVHARVVTGDPATEIITSWLNPEGASSC
jgi:hypothetical protein